MGIQAWNLWLTVSPMVVVGLTSSLTVTFWKEGLCAPTVFGSLHLDDAQSIVGAQSDSSAVGPN